MAEHILIVEDDTIMRENIAMFLETSGYRVTQAADGETALDLLETTTLQGGCYDVVVTDIMMGAVDGVQVMEVARKQPYKPEVILLTGHGSLETAMTALRTNAFDYLLKPCRITILIERVAAALDYRKELQRKDEEAAAGRKFAQLAGQLHLPADQHYPAVHPSPTASYSTTNLSSASPSSTEPPQRGSGDDGPETMDKQRTPAAGIDPSGKGSTMAKNSPLSSAPPTELLDHPPAEDPASATPAPAKERYLQVGQLCVDTYRYKIWFQKRRIDVTPTEYAVLACLAATPGRACTFAEITRHTHGTPLERTDAQQLLGTHVRNIRKKLDRRYLVSVRGVGYMLVDPEEEQ
jgi:DNA-binding response OmpR family regulator